MEKALQNRVGYFFIAILIIATLGFYPTYLSKFPTFEGFTSVHHFHGFMGVAWIVMLITQALLIRVNQYRLHRMIGKWSFVVMPLLMVSLFMVARTTYFHNITIKSKADALAGLVSGIPDAVFLGILFTLAMVYRKRTGWHLRFMTSTGLMILGPGLGRFLIVFCGLPFQLAIPLLVGSTTGAALVWMILDIRQKKSAFPMGTFVAMGMCAFVLGAGSHSAWWQSFAGWMAANLF